MITPFCIKTPTNILKKAKSGNFGNVSYNGERQKNSQLTTFIIKICKTLMGILGSKHFSNSSKGTLSLVNKYMEDQLILQYMVGLYI